jgi:hypothetical protein
MSVVSATAILAASVAGLAYLDGYYSISRDVRQLLADRKFKKRLDARIGLMGTHITTYHMFEFADPSAEALWFEGRSWTYGEALRGCYPDLYHPVVSNNVFTVADGLAEIIHARGVKSSDSVAVFMTNSPEMVFVLLALSKIGGIPALINNSLRSTDSTLPFCGLSGADDCR